MCVCVCAWRGGTNSLVTATTTVGGSASKAPVSFSFLAISDLCQAWCIAPAGGCDRLGSCSSWS